MRGNGHQSCILPWKKTVEINELQYKCMPVLNSNQVHMHVHVSYFSSPFASFNVILWGKYHKICVGKQVKADLVTLTRNMKFFFSFWRLTYLVPFQKVRLSYACKKIVSTGFVCDFMSKSFQKFYNLNNNNYCAAWYTYYQLSWYHKLATVKSFKADISSVSPLSFILKKG